MRVKAPVRSKVGRPVAWMAGWRETDVSGWGVPKNANSFPRHGLTAETVIGALEDAEDYKAFEAAIIADYDAQSAVERELVLRLASLLWRLRRATAMETGLFEIQTGHLREFRQASQALPESREIIHAMFGRA